MATWFRTFVALGQISEVDVVHFTDKTVTYMDHGKRRRGNRITEYQSYFPTREEAIRFTLDYYEAQIETARSRLAFLEGRRDKFMIAQGVAYE